MFNIIAYILPIIMGVLEILRAIFPKGKFFRKAIYIPIITALVAGSLFAQWKDNKKQEDIQSDLNSNIASLNNREAECNKKMDSLVKYVKSLPEGNRILKMFDINGDNNTINASNIYVNQGKPQNR